MDIGVTGQTRIVPIIGDPVAQVKSPGPVTSLLQQAGYDGIVVPMQVAADDLEAFFSLMRRIKNIAGLIITVPHKISAIRHCDVIGNRAAIAQSVNVIRCVSMDCWAGDQTDGMGLVGAIHKRRASVLGQNILLIGAGGAGRAIAYELLLHGAHRVAIHDLDRDRQRAVMASLERKFPGRLDTGDHNPTGFDVIVNASPLGMRDDDPPPFDIALLKADQIVADVVTSTHHTPIIAEAEKQGCITISGHDMFEAQAEILANFVMGGSTI